MTVLVIVLLKVYFEKQIFLHYSILLTAEVLFPIFELAPISSEAGEATLGSRLRQVLQTDRDGAFRLETLFLTRLLVLDCIVVVVLRVLLEAWVVANHTVSLQTITSREVNLRSFLNEHRFVNAVRWFFTRGNKLAGEVGSTTHS